MNTIFLGITTELTLLLAVTGANDGIGLALCKRLVTEKGCFVYMGSRSVERGTAAMDSLGLKDSMELVQCDVSDDASVAAAAATTKASLEAKGAKLFALVNNAGIGPMQVADLPSNVEKFQGILNVNFTGVKRMSEAFLPLIEPAGGAIVNCGSGAAPGWCKKQDSETQAFFCNPEVTFEALEARVQGLIDKIPEEGHPMGGYGTSKAILASYTMAQAKAYPNLLCCVLSPGFIVTKLTAGWGAKLSPEEGCVAYLRVLFEPNAVSGYFYGSDGLRSPVTMTRDPGTKEYEGEPEPDINADDYNK